MTDRQRIEQLEKRVERLEGEASGSWKPWEDKEYFVASPTLDCFAHRQSWCDDNSDRRWRDRGLIRKTEAEAVTLGKQMCRVQDLMGAARAVLDINEIAGIPEVEALRDLHDKMEAM